MRGLFGVIVIFNAKFILDLGMVRIHKVFRVLGTCIGDLCIEYWAIEYCVSSIVYCIEYCVYRVSSIEYCVSSIVYRVLGTCVM